MFKRKKEEFGRVNRIWESMFDQGVLDCTELCPTMCWELGCPYEEPQVADRSLASFGPFGHVFSPFLDKIDCLEKKNKQKNKLSSNHSEIIISLVRWVIYDTFSFSYRKNSLKWLLEKGQNFDFCKSFLKIMKDAKRGWEHIKISKDACVSMYMCPIDVNGKLLWNPSEHWVHGQHFTLVINYYAWLSLSLPLALSRICYWSLDTMSSVNCWLPIGCIFVFMSLGFLYPTLVHGVLVIFVLRPSLILNRCITMRGLYCCIAYCHNKSKVIACCFF